MSEGRRKWMAQLKERERELTLPLPFHFFRALNMLDDSSFLYTVHLFVCVLSHQSCLFVTPWTVAHHGLSMRLSRQEYWSGLPFAFPGDLPNPEIKPTSPALAGRFYTTELPRKPIGRTQSSKIHRDRQ